MTIGKVQGPLIGITPDVGTDLRGEAAYSIRRNYTDAILAAGGVPVILPCSLPVEHYLTVVDGLVITGGFFDIDPALYGQSPRKVLVTNADRTCFEKSLIDGALTSKLPILGICNGMQLLAVCLGGELMQDISEEVPAALDHKPDSPASLRHHSIRITYPSDRVPKLGNSTFHVNSLHHQAVLPSAAYRTVAVADDGVIEAIEAVDQDFALGVQWHPEYALSPIDEWVLDGFVTASQRYRDARLAVRHA